MLHVRFKYTAILIYSTSQPFLLVCILERYWPFLEKSGPQKWVVGATLALKQNFLAGTLLGSLFYHSNRRFNFSKHQL